MMLLFIDWHWWDLLDILLVALLFYQVFVLIRGTQAWRIFAGMLILYVVYLLVDALQMKLLSQILGQFIGVGVIALIIVFQQEIRRFLLLLGNTERFNRRLLQALFSGQWTLNDRSDLDFTELKKALETLSQSKTGALLVFIRENRLSYYQKSGQRLDAQFSSNLVQQLFFANTPLHDGALLIRRNIIRAAKCILPITEQARFPAHLGLRHRAAAGITEISDALAIVVSEQTGQISWSQAGQLVEDLSVEEAVEKLQNQLEKNKINSAP